MEGENSSFLFLYKACSKRQIWCFIPDQGMLLCQTLRRKQGYGMNSSNENQVARKISRVTPPATATENVALRVPRKVEISLTFRNVARQVAAFDMSTATCHANFVKIRQSKPFFCSQEISSWRRKSCKQFPGGALQVAKKYCERVTLPLQLAVFSNRHRGETNWKKNCLL